MFVYKHTETIEFIKKYKLVRAHFKPLLGATIAPNLVPWIFKKIFSLEMAKNDIYFGGVSQENDLFFDKCAPKKCTHAPNH